MIGGHPSEAGCWGGFGAISSLVRIITGAGAPLMPDLARCDLQELCGASTLMSGTVISDWLPGKKSYHAGQHENRFDCHTLPRIWPHGYVLAKRPPLCSQTPCKRWMGGVARSRGKGAELIVSGKRDTSTTKELAPLRPLHGEAERRSEPIAAAWGTALSMEVSPRFRLCRLRGSRRESFLRCTAGRALSPPRGIVYLQAEAPYPSKQPVFRSL